MASSLSEKTSPTRDELLARMEELRPLLRERAFQVDQDSRLDEEVLEALSEAGVFRLGTPRRFGGLEADLRTQQDVFSAIARGCGSTGWVSSLYGFGSWATGWYEDQAQQEVFAEDPNVRIAGIFSPTGDSETCRRRLQAQRPVGIQHGMSPRLMGSSRRNGGDR